MSFNISIVCYIYLIYFYFLLQVLYTEICAIFNELRRLSSDIFELWEHMTGLANRDQSAFVVIVMSYININTQWRRSLKGITQFRNYLPRYSQISDKQYTTLVKIYKKLCAYNVSVIIFSLRYMWKLFISVNAFYVNSEIWSYYKIILVYISVSDSWF